MLKSYAYMRYSSPRSSCGWRSFCSWARLGRRLFLGLFLTLGNTSLIVSAVLTVRHCAIRPRLELRRDGPASVPGASAVSVWLASKPAARLRSRGGFSPEFRVLPSRHADEPPGFLKARAEAIERNIAYYGCQTCEVRYRNLPVSTAPRLLRCITSRAGSGNPELRAD
ncbi:MAG: hypothetical protein R3F54_28855 [Alphaproteobacteria bacterium]